MKLADTRALDKGFERIFECESDETCVFSGDCEVFGNSWTRSKRHRRVEARLNCGCRFTTAVNRRGAFESNRGRQTHRPFVLTRESPNLRLGDSAFHTISEGGDAPARIKRPLSKMFARRLHR